MNEIHFQNARLFDGEQMQDGRFDVLVSGTRIAAVSAVPLPPMPDATVFDLQGRTLMPGLIDAHYHCNSPSLDVASIDHMHGSHLAQHARKYLEATLQRGFTTVRDAGGADMGLVRSVEEGLIEGPRLFIAGKALSQTGGHGDLRSADWQDICGCVYRGGVLSTLADGTDEVRRAVRNQLRQGVHQIKIFVSGGVLSPTDPIWMDQFTDPEILAAVDEARRWRTYVMAHAHTADAARRCAKNGVRSIEHGTLIDREAADVVARHGTFVVPTLAVIEGILSGVVELPPALLEKARTISDKAREAVRHCLDAGVRIGLGTDLFGQLHGREMQELVLRADVGGACHTLQSATSINAEIIGMKGQLGTIQVGARADMLVLEGNPIETIQLFLDPEKNLKIILKNGRFVKNDLSARVCASVQ